MMRILVVKLSSLGDLFHALPAVHAIRRGMGVRVDWVVHDAYGDCVGRFTDVNRVIRFQRRAFWSTLPAFWRELRRECYDWVLDLQGNLKSAMVSRHARSCRLVGPSFNREGSRWFYPEVAGPPHRDRHAVEQILDTVRYLGLPAGEPVFPVSFPTLPLAESRPRIAMIPFSRWASKNWPLGHFAVLGRELQQATGGSVTLLGGREDVVSAEALARAMGGGAVNRVGALSLVELGSVLSGMDLVIGNDTGPLHMAAALGVPVLGLYGPTNPARTGPFGPGHRVLMPTDCVKAPCYRRHCPMSDRFCLATIQPETVRDEALAMLGLRS